MKNKKLLERNLMVILSQTHQVLGLLVYFVTKLVGLHHVAAGYSLG